MNLNIKDIKSLIEMVDKSGLTEFEWSFEGESITLKKEKEFVSHGAVSYAAPVQMSAPVAQVSDASSVSSAPPSVVIADDFLEIRSPMVGTYYTASSPDAEAYAKVGDSISKGQVVCIVEAMKLMNEIESEVSGKILEICIENGKPVEFGTLLYKVSK
jgi:acetyl-CoA carboxylase biotin carboxyl carrier protein